MALPQAYIIQTSAAPRVAHVTAVVAAMLLGVAMPSRAEDFSAVTAPATDFTKPERYEAMQGGAGTSRKHPNANAFSNPSHNLDGKQRMDFAIGNGFFKRLWVSAPASTKAADGLGPLFNARSCQRCHLKDGRGHAPEANWPDDTAVSMLLKLGIVGEDGTGIEPDPTYGTQLQDTALPGHEPEGHLHIRYTEVPVTLGDGSTVSLRAPEYAVTDLGYGPLHPGTVLSPRVAPPMIGLGLLEAIDAADILAEADPDDRDDDGISGRPNRARDLETDQMALGRFGWKAAAPSVRQQSAMAFSGDIGISTALFPGGWGECTEAQATCRAAPDGGDQRYENLEAPDEVLDLVAHYSANLAVPKRRNVKAPKVLEGKRLFYESGCVGCHRPKFVTRADAERPEHRRQLIWPYTDMLLHNMGDGLADNRPEGEATGREWRTPPLWGIGLTETVNGHTQFLHDGRARNLLEAILWHGGEAESSKRKVVEMDKAERDALLAFLNSL